MVSESSSSADPSEVFAEVGDRFFYGYSPKPGDAVIDVGAGVGYDSLCISRLVGSAGRVFAIEAHPDTFHTLDVLARVNPLERIVPIHAAVTDTDGIVTISAVGTVTSNIFGHAPSGIEVPSRRLDSLLDEHSISHVDLLKMNIEGAEVLALEGGVRTIERTRHVVVECHDFLADRGEGEHLRTRAKVESFLKARGFEVLPARASGGRSWLPFYVYARQG